jgi:tRNA U38,U39,U40 pseudouridine synthase TruA
MKVVYSDLHKSTNNYFDEVVFYRENDVAKMIASLDARFHKITRGYHYWTWKSFIIEKLLQNVWVMP